MRCVGSSFIRPFVCVIVLTRHCELDAVRRQFIHSSVRVRVSRVMVLTRHCELDAVRRQFIHSSVRVRVSRVIVLTRHCELDAVRRQFIHSSVRSCARFARDSSHPSL